MRTAVLTVLLACGAFAQTERSLVISRGVPIADGPAEDFLQFFYNLRILGQQELSVEARALGMSEDQLRSVMDITADLAEKSIAFHEMWHPWKFESLMEVIDNGSMSPSTETKMRDFQKQWTAVVMEHVERLRSVLGLERFRELDAFVHSGRPMFASPVDPKLAPAK
jgi:hypothetical protein